jgi:hypothetical protein
MEGVRVFSASKADCGRMARPLVAGRLLVRLRETASTTSFRFFVVAPLSSPLAVLLTAITSVKSNYQEAR